MANDATAITLPRSFSVGRGIYIDNQPAELQAVNKDASTDVTVTAVTLVRINSAVVFDADGAEIEATIAGLGTKVLELTDLGAGTLDLLVVMKGSRL